jgi:uncharacterized protein (TIGR02145 family)
MKNLLIVLIIFCAIEANAQNYLISFTGTGASTTVSSVEIENLTAGTSHTINGDDILGLTMTTGVQSTEYVQSSEIKIYPNPMTDKSKLLISAPVAGEAIISIYDMTGKQLSHNQSYLENYTQEFTLSGLISGLYLVNVKGNNYQLSERLVSNGRSNGTPSIEKVSDNIAVDKKVSKIDTKGVQATVDMEYTAGDRLKFKGISGIYSTVITDIPTESKTITFNFIACTDGDDINYPVVEIGTQLWMVENLKTTKYNDGTDIPLVTNLFEWRDLTTEAYCWYKNDAATYKTPYGALYNWHAVNTGKLCPTGWHVPTNDEWVTLVDYLGGSDVAGGKLKETGTTNWDSPNTDATNEVGFIALPGGMRDEDGGFYAIGYDGYWWSATEFSTGSGRGRGMGSDHGEVSYVYSHKEFAFSVRCVRD